MNQIYTKRILYNSIDDALQAVHSSNWILSFNVTQAHLQLAMEDNGIRKAAFRAGSLSL